MADTTVTIKQDGTGDYSTIGSAISASSTSSGYWKMVIDDSNSYNESIDLTPNSGGTTSSNYMWLTVSEGNRHSGVAASSGHARIYHTGNYVVRMGSHAYNYARIEYLEVECTGTSSYTHGIEGPGAAFLASRCIVHGTGSSGSNYVRGIYTTSILYYGGTIDNCLVYNCDQGMYMYTSGFTGPFKVDHCTVVNNSANNFYIYKGPGGNGDIKIYNTGIAGVGSGNDFSVTYADSSGSFPVTGSHNAYDAASAYNVTLTDTQNISSGGVTTTTTTASAMIVTNLTSGSEDFTPVKATGSGSNLLLGNATNRQGSEPDSRQDFSTDIRGKERPTTAGKIDIGAFQISGAAGFKYYNGSAFVDASAVQYYNGSAWVDVSGIQYYNGSAWTDPS